MSTGTTISTVVMLLSLCLQQSWADAVQPGVLYSDQACIECHAEREPDLVQQWRMSAHGEASGVDCSGCHGERHQQPSQRMTVQAREDATCAGCHQGSAAHSYVTSKHGVINTIEASRQDWSAPLQVGNYRAPGCSYCHNYGGDHSDTMAPERGPAVRQWICAGCHSPRYVREQFENGVRQLAIADLKLAEGDTLLATADHLEEEQRLALKQSQLDHRRNVLYGVGHQSPDYQWWHGQPALDGDLIRIRDAVDKSQRREPLRGD
ncbi:MAG: hypothetical protein HN842_09955 [Gammaproteobacteria bacterium]|jgi:predicted CXXCH cytochrome family protein|nr:hypothetical protein [Gammaproteobacteria bacterium]